MNRTGLLAPPGREIIARVEQKHGGTAGRQQKTHPPDWRMG
jgi:hypothetical protein